jgi:hypothetical protein
MFPISAMKRLPSLRASKEVEEYRKVKAVAATMKPSSAARDLLKLREDRVNNLDRHKKVLADLIRMRKVEDKDRRA